MIHTSTLHTPPEYDRASQVIGKYYLKMKETNTMPSTTHGMTSNLWKSTDSLVCINRRPKIRDIPSGIGWRWNQAKRRFSMVNEETGFTIEILKLVPRKSAGSSLEALPKLKLWQGSFYNDENTTIFWCEKGEDHVSTDLKLSDYSFLSKFMDNRALGDHLWPNTDKD